VVFLLPRAVGAKPESRKKETLSRNDVRQAIGGPKIKEIKQIGGSGGQGFRYYLVARARVPTHARAHVQHARAHDCTHVRTHRGEKGGEFAGPRITPWYTTERATAISDSAAATVSVKIASNWPRRSSKFINTP
jgi:hypothetical protein